MCPCCGDVCSYRHTRNKQVQHTTYRILHELSFDINVYETSLGNVIKAASDKLYTCNVIE